MIPGNILQKVGAYLSERHSAPCTVRAYQAMAGGCIHRAFRLETSEGPFFLKWNQAREAGNLEAEFRGLRLLERYSPGLPAEPLLTGSDQDHCFLLMEFVASAAPGARFWEDFGRRLAGLHKCSSTFFGLEEDNFIGRLPQHNRPHDDFVSFFIAERLEVQLELARRSGLLDQRTLLRFERLYKRLPDLIPAESPALLHGDLWRGNFLCPENGHVRLIDPAVYFGHREAELAFTRLFGGFDEQFYSAYMEAFPLQAGWPDRCDIFNLYPLLVHLNLFGSSYLPEIESILAHHA